MPRYTRTRSVLPTAPTLVQRLRRTALLQRLVARLREALLLAVVLAALAAAMHDDYHELVLPHALLVAEEVQP